MNHRDTFIDDGSGIFTSSLVAMKDQKWKDMRSTLTPAFTGSKLRMMFQLIKEISDQAVQHLYRKGASDKGFDLDMKDFFNHSTNDVIASVAFGINIDSLEDENNEFFQYGKKISKYSKLQILKYFFYINFERLSKKLGLKVFDVSLLNYFKKLVLDAMEYRKKNNIHRPDMINLLMEARNNDSKNQWSDIEIVAQCFVFFIAGFETTSTLLSFACHEIMENPDIQQRLFEEIELVKQSLGQEELNYEDVNKMSYLDAIVSETLRKWPNATVTDRQCNRTILIPNPDGLGDVVIKEGELVWISIAGLHRDAKYFEDPNVFNPERFNKENKKTIQPFSYIPFGIGPRSCIGNRFAMMMAKTILFHIVGNFKLKPSSKSTIPLDLTGGGFKMQPKNGFWLHLKKRNFDE